MEQYAHAEQNQLSNATFATSVYNGTPYSANGHIVTSLYENREIDISLLIQSVITLLVNVLLFVFIVKQKKLRRKISNKFFLNLLSVHILLSIVFFLSMFYQSNLKLIFKNATLMLMFLGMMINTCDRFVAIQYPYKYERLNTKSVLAVLLVSWVLPVTSIILSWRLRIEDRYCMFICSILMVTSTSVLTVSNYKIYCIARRHVEVIKHNSVDTASRKNMKSLYVCFTIVASFIVLMLPHFVHNLLAISKMYKSGDDKMFTKLVVKIAFLNSLVDPILYVCFSRDVKKALRGMFCMKVHGSSNIPSSKDTNGTEA